MKDNMGRSITHINISVTDRCNLRCRYCMPEEGICCVSEEELLKREEILRLVNVAASLGIRSVTLTGGEPLLREDLTELIRELKALPDLEKVSLLSNGLFLYPLLPQLKEAGMDEVMIHLDTTQSQQYKRLTRGKISSAEVLRPIWRAVSMDLSIRIFCVLQEETKDEILILAGLSRHYPIDVDFSELLPVRWWHEVKPLSADEALRRLRISYPDLNPVGDEGIFRCYRSSKLKGNIRILRVRGQEGENLEGILNLSCDGKLQKGIEGKDVCDLKQLLRENASDVDIKAAMRGYILEHGRQKVI